MAIQPSQNMLNLIQQQINREYESAYLYLSMSLYLKSRGLSGMSRWMHKQYEEEVEHTMMFINFLTDIGQSPVLNAIAKPKNNWDSVEQVFTESLDHEKFITSSIDNMIETADNENFNRIRSLLNWFSKEQVEEESMFLNIIDRLEIAGKAGLLVVDMEMGNRE